MTERLLLWAYGVVPAAQPVPDVTGIEGRPVSAITHEGVALLASSVPAERFDAEPLQQRLETIEIVAELAHAHESVLEAAMAGGDVVPFRMCAIYKTQEAAERMLASEAGRFEALLSQLHDKAEWGVKVFAKPAAAASGQRQVSSGVEYLAARRAQRESAETNRDAIEAAVAELHVALADRAAAAVLSRPHDRRLSGRDDEMVLNGAYLLARDSRDDLVGLLRALGRSHRDKGLTLELTGPWPPYHFVGEAAA